MNSDYHINIFYSETDGCFVADIPDLDMCSAFGDSPEEALKEVMISKKLWLKTAREQGIPIPEPNYKPRAALPNRRMHSVAH